MYKTNCGTNNPVGVTNCSQNPKELGYKPNELNTINL